MFDPLNSTVAFGGEVSSQTPSWPTTPRPPGSPIPNLRPANTPGSSTPDKGPTPGLYGREPQIYGQSEPGFISPNEAVLSNGATLERREPYLKVKITGLDRNRRDILIKFDAQTNLSNFSGTKYRNVSRSYLEFQQFYESIVFNNPQTIIAALPLAQTSAPTDEEDDRLVKIMLQRWMTRVCEDPILVNDEDVRAFIESDFGYQPTPKPRKKASSGFSLIRRQVPDEDEDLQRTRFELTKLETQFFDAAKAVDRLAITRKALATSHSEMGNKLINIATNEAHPPLGNALRKFGRVWHSLGDLDHAKAISECVIVADSLGYQGMNAKSAKETLQMRTGVLEEYQAAVKATISKRRHIERLKASSNIRHEKVDEALADMTEADRYEQILAKRAEGISQNLHQALRTHNRNANDDITTALIEHARSSLMYERQSLKELETLRSDVANAAKKVFSPSTGPPKPKVILPLEDYSDHPRSAPIAPTTNGGRVAIPPTPSGTFNPHSKPALSVDSLANSQTSNFSQSRQSAPSQVQAFPGLDDPLNPTFLVGPQQMAASTPTLVSPGTQGFTPPIQQTKVAPVQLPGVESSSYQSPLHAPPLDRFDDGSRIRPAVASTSQPITATPVGTSQTFDPLRSSAIAQITATSPSNTSMFQGQRAAGIDPASQVRSQQMAPSIRVQPTRPRLDAKEAASKLANMF